MALHALKKTCTLLLSILLLSTTLSPVFAQTTGASSTGAGTGTSTSLPATSTVSTVSGPLACTLSAISPEEAQRLKDALYVDPEGTFKANEIGSGQDPNKNRQKVSEDGKVLLPDPNDDKKGVIKEVPNEKFSPGEAPQILNRVSKDAAFQIALVLDDTLRTGRPSNAVEEVTGLQLRNGGTGISSNVKNVYTDVKKIFDSDQGSAAFDKSSATIIQAELESNADLETEDANTFNIEEFKRTRNTNLMNAIVTDSFNAHMETTCNDGSCVISLYSMFDKYFNSWFSLEMVGSTFGPTAFGKIRKMFSLAERRSLLTTKLVKGIEDKFAFRFKEKSLQKLPSEYFNSVTGVGGRDVILNRWRKVLEHESTFSDVYAELYRAGPNTTIIRTGGFDGWIGKQFKEPDGLLLKVKDFTQRKKFFTVTSKFTQYFHVANTLAQESKKEYTQALKEIIARNSAINVEGVASPSALYLAALQVDKAAAEAASFKYANHVSKIMRDIDDTLSVDFPAEIFRKKSELGLRGKFVKDPTTGEHIDIAGGEGKFYDNGIFDVYKNAESVQDGFSKSFFEKVPGRSNTLQLYEIKPAGIETPTSIQGLEDILKNLGPGSPKKAVRLSNFQYVEVTPNNLEQIKADAVRTNNVVQIVDAGFQPKGELDPIHFGNEIISADFIPDKINTAARNQRTFRDALIAKDWSSARYGDWLSKQLQEEDELIKAYFSNLPKAAKWTVVPYIYVWGKKGFDGLFGIEGDKYSAFRLPDEYSVLDFSPGNEEIYKDAYIDFFSHEGSDQGDIFTRVINNMFVWGAFVVTPLVSSYKPVDDLWQKARGTYSRDTPENLAFYLYGPDDCSACNLSLASQDAQRTSIHASFHATQNYSSILFEDRVTKDAKEKGQVLVSFAHHADIKGKLQGQESTNPINIAAAKGKNETCEQKARSLPLGVGLIADFAGGGSAGGVLAITESLTYYIFGLPGIFATAVQQLYFAPELNDCVDDQEGYFANFYQSNPEAKSSKEEQDLSKFASNNVLDGIRKAADKAEKDFSTGSLTDKAVREVATQVKDFADNAQEHRLVQGRLELQGDSHGTLKSKEMLWYWVAGGGILDKAAYETEGKMVLIGGDNKTVVIDNASGTITVDGKPTLTEADHVRLNSINNQIPAIEVPNRLGKYALPDNNEVLFEINVQGELVVRDSLAANCIQQAVFDQSGLVLNSPNLADAFGLVQNVTTTTHSNVFPDPTNNQIVAEGLARKVVRGSDSRIQVLNSASVLLREHEVPSIGRLNSIQFKNGLMIYKPETRELLIWLKHDERAVISKDDVTGFNAELTQTKNPETNCDEPAVDFSVTANPDNDQATERAKNFNTSIKKQGPFQTFETDSKIFVFYSKLVEGACKDYFKVVDKKTGEVLVDQEISNIKQNPDGTIEVQTADGRNHTLEFGEEGGQPTLKYNDGAPELLRSATGKNGSFYYDPKKGLYYPENAQLIPTNDDFRNKGLGVGVNPDGSVSAKPSGNTFIINPGQGTGGLFNVASLPTNLFQLGAFAFLLMIAFAISYTYKKKPEENVQ